MRHCAALLTTVFLLLLLAGCWDRREINDVAFVAASAIDLEGDKLRLTVQFPLPSQMGGAGSSGGGGGTAGNKAWYNESAVARTAREGVAIEQQSLSRILNFSHRRVLIVGEALAKDGIGPMLDILGRIPQNRMTAYFMLSEGKAADLLRIEAPLEKMPAEMLRELVSLPYKRPISIETVVNALLQEGVDPYLPYVTVEKAKKPKLDGVALFKNDKLAGVLTGTAAEGLLFALNQSQQPIITVAPPDGQGFISSRMTSYNVRIDSIRRGNRPSFRVTLSGVVVMSENASNYRISADQDTTIGLERVINDQIEKSIRKALDATQRIGVDPVGFGLYLYHHYPAYWRRIEKDWRERYRNADIQVVSRTRFEHPGTLTYPLGIPKEDLVP